MHRKDEPFLDVKAFTDHFHSLLREQNCHHCQVYPKHWYFLC